MTKKTHIHECYFENNLIIPEALKKIHAKKTSNDIRKWIDTCIMKEIEAAHMRTFSEMNDYLENIANSPSTINRILPYYMICVDIYNPNKRCIMFNGEIIKEYEIFPKKRYDWISKRGIE